MGKLIRKATGLTVGVATLLAGLVLPMTASAESASPIDASPIIHYSFDNALTSKTIANEGSAANSDATLSGDATVANGQISLTGSQTISVRPRPSPVRRTLPSPSGSRTITATAIPPPRTSARPRPAIIRPTATGCSTRPTRVATRNP